MRIRAAGDPRNHAILYIVSIDRGLSPERDFLIKRPENLKPRQLQQPLNVHGRSGAFRIASRIIQHTVPKSIAILYCSQAARQAQRDLLKRRKRSMVTVHHFHSVGERHEYPAVTTAPQHWGRLAGLPVPHVVEQARLLVLQVACMQDELLRGVVDIGRLVFHLAEPGQQRAGHVQREGARRLGIIWWVSHL